MTRHHLGAVTYVQQNSDAGKLEGFVEAWPRVNRPEWDLAFVAPSPDGGGAGKVWQRLLSTLIVVAGERNVSRIYARAPQGVQVEQILCQVGFTLVRREEIFVLASQTVPATRVEGLRGIRAGDDSALAALCHRVQSRLGKGAEDVSPHRVLDFYPYLHGGTTNDEYVWQQGDTVVAYLGLQGSSHGYWLDIVVDPDSRADVLPCIRYILSLTQCGEDMPLYCPVPEHTPWLGHLLQDLGFTSYTTQAVLVTHTKARTPIRCEIPVTALENGIDMGAPVSQMFEPSVRKK
ncbi:MAG: hypothetical protein ACLFV5_11140 [Anaerolineales bacterium]